MSFFIQSLICLILPNFGINLHTITCMKIYTFIVKKYIQKVLYLITKTVY